MNIVHFDIDDTFAPYFREKKYHWALNDQSVAKVSTPALIDIITIKSSSILSQVVLKKLPALEGIMARTVGVNNVDLKFCKTQNIAVYHIPDYGSFAIAEHVFALILSKARKIIDLQIDIKEGKFNYSKGQGFTLQNKTMGVIGIGKIGKEVIKIAKGFQMNCLGFDIKKSRRFALQKNFRYTNLKTLLKLADFIVLTLNLNSKTHHLIDNKSLKLIKPGTVLINVSRGEIINTQALLKHIDKFRFVGLDVIEGEQIFNKQNHLLAHKNILITPHIAFFTDRTTTQIATITNRNIQYFLDGKNKNRIV